MAREITTSEFDDAVQRHLAGETQSEVAATLGLTQGAFSLRMKRAGYVGISRSEAARRKAARMTVEERQEMSAAAHDAVRGMTRTSTDLERRALGKQVAQSHATAEERAVAAVLTRQGHGVVLQQAAGKYNLDLAVEGAVAVELFGGGWHGHGRHRARLPQRVKDLADAGWNLLIVWSSNGVHVEPDVVAQDVLTYLQRTRSDPTFRRQYRVIRGDGQFIAAGSVDDDELTLVPTGVRGAYAGRR